jgi:CBS domain-containing protein
VDLKRQGISPVVFLARCYGLEVGSRARNTLERLDAACKAGLMGEEAWGNVGDAYRFLIGLRLRLQLRTVQEGGIPKNAVALADLSAIERGRLKDSLRAVRTWQEEAAFHYQTSF